VGDNVVLASERWQGILDKEGLASSTHSSGCIDSGVQK